MIESVYYTRVYWIVLHLQINNVTYRLRVSSPFHQGLSLRSLQPNSTKVVVGLEGLSVITVLCGASHRRTRSVYCYLRAPHRAKPAFKGRGRAYSQTGPQPLC